MEGAYSPQEILETIRMVQMESLDIRTITMGISLRDCACDDVATVARRVFEKICSKAEHLVATAGEIERRYGIPVVNTRVSVTPISLVLERDDRHAYLEIAAALDRAAAEVGVNFIGGYSALVEKGTTPGESALIASIPEALATTERVCASVNVGSTHAGINMDAVALMGEAICEAASLTAERDGIGAAKLVVFCNAVSDNPFMAGAFHGISEPETVINVGVSGPGVILRAVEAAQDTDFGGLASAIKRAAFKVTRMGELVGRAASERLGVDFGIVDLSLAPTPARGDSVARILEAMGLEHVGTHGSTAALAILNDAVKKGGAMASSYVGGLSGAFIPVSEDIGMIEAAQAGLLTIDKLEAMTAVCSVGIDMVAVPGDTPAETIAAVIADEAAIGMINRKTTAVRIIPAPARSSATGSSTADSSDTPPSWHSIQDQAPCLSVAAAGSRPRSSRSETRHTGIRSLPRRSSEQIELLTPQEKHCSLTFVKEDSRSSSRRPPDRPRTILSYTSRPDVERLAVTAGARPARRGS